MCCFFWCPHVGKKTLSEVDEGIRCKGKHWKHPLFFPGVDWEIISSTDIYFAQKRQVRFGIPPPKKAPGFRSFFHRKEKTTCFLGKGGIWKNWLGSRQVPPWCPSFGIDLELLFLEKNNPQQNGTAKDLTKIWGTILADFLEKKTMDHILHGRILVWIRGTVCHVT